VYGKELINTVSSCFSRLCIFSLQGTMDFEFDIQTGQNEVYSKMLLSYPIGTQIVIKQCMKKLTG
jgi:hypothetical protein